jgi:hypothetical protein
MKRDKLKLKLGYLQEIKETKRKKAWSLKSLDRWNKKKYNDGPWREKE